MNTFTKACLMGSTILTLSLSAQANAKELLAMGNHDHHAHHDHSAPSAPIGIMGDHAHAKGDWMVSYRFSRMHMEGNRTGTSSISPEEIATTIANPNAPPATLRVVPTEMDMDMHMLGAMYGVTDNLTLTLMGMFMKNEMEHVTFAGMSGTTRLGKFTTRSSGWGDTQIGALYKLYKTPKINLNASLNISIPTGSIKEEDDVLTPMNTTPTLRLPYAMQLGSGTWDAKPSITYSGNHDDWFWGAQYNATIRLESENDQGYRLGNIHAINFWGGYKINNSWSVNALINGETQGKIKGQDTNIAAPVQTANPDNYGGERLELGAGFTYSPQKPSLKGLEFGAQLRAPIYEDVHGVQLERDWRVSTALTYRF